MTETAAAATITHADDLTTGTVGGPVAVNEIRLQDVPDMGYFHTDQVMNVARHTLCVGNNLV